MTQLVPRHHRWTAPRRARSEAGGVLLLTLAAIAMFGVVVVALLGLTLTGARVGSNTTAELRRQRAVDGALEVGVNRLKTSPGAVLGRPGNCAPLEGQTVTVDGVTSTLRCAPEPSTTPEVAGPGGVALTTLGGFTGTLDDVVDNRLDPLISGLASGLGAWFRSQFAEGPGLAHFGQDALRIAGDVRVRNGAFGYRFTGNPNVAGPSPAFDITGSYSQGQCGPIGCLDFSLFGIPILTSPACGLLVPNVVPGQEFGSGLSATGGLNCNLGSANALFADPAPSAPAAWSATALRSGPALPAECPKVGNVVTIQPGAYGVMATRVLNQWFGPGNCDDVTFWFPPGDYSFDSAGLWGGERNTLMLADPTARWVFGAPRGWSAPGGASAANFPGACDTSAQGVSITLTVRTSIKHRAGLVAACGRRDAEERPLPLVYQPVPSSAPVTWAARPTTATTNNHPTIRFNTPERALDSAGPVPSPAPGSGTAYPTGEATRAYATTTCTTFECNPTLILGGFTDPAFPAPYGALVRDANFPFAPQVFLKIRGTAAFSNQWFGFPKVMWTVFLGDGSTNPDGTPTRCTGELASTMPSNPETNVLTIPIGQECLTQAGLVDASQLEGARVEITYKFSTICGWFGCPSVTAGIDHAWLEATTDPSSALPASMEVAVDPAGGTAAYWFGPVYVPKSQTEVRWKGSANESPLFVGGLTTRALASGPPDATTTNYRTGIVASGGLAPSQRIVTLSAVADGRLRGSAKVVITDDDPARLRLDPGRLLEVVDWRYCNRPASAASCWAP